MVFRAIIIDINISCCIWKLKLGIPNCSSLLEKDVYKYVGLNEQQSTLNHRFNEQNMMIE